jgi:hypothetical protein
MAGPSDALLQALAQAEAQPDRWARAVNTGAQAGQNILGGLVQGMNIRQQIQSFPLKIAQQKAAIFDNYTKLAQAVGPDRAAQLMGPTMQQAGISLPSGNGTNPTGQNVNPDASSNAPTSTPTSDNGGSPYSPAQLTTMGEYGKNVLGAQRTAQEMALANQPRNPQAYKSAIMQTGLISPEAFDAWAQSNTDQNGMIPSQNAEFLEKSLGLKAQGNRAEFYKTQVGRNQLELLPSQSGPNTAQGAAYQVKVAARQGKSLIANATTPQSLALASVDLSRAVQRAAPVSETIGAGSYGSSLPTIWGQLTQKITADPNSPDVPLLRKQLYNTFNELDQAATPWISNHLDNMEANGTNSSFGNAWGQTREREMGSNIPDVPFNPGPSLGAPGSTVSSSGSNLSGSGANPNVSTGLPTQPNPDDQAALQWSLQNPSDPRAAAVQGKLRAKGVIQ